MPISTLEPRGTSRTISPGSADVLSAGGGPPVRTESAAPSDGLPFGWDDFESLYDQYHVRLYRFALLLCNGRRAVAEDVVAETFMLLFQAWRSGRVQNVFGYARRTLLNVVLGQYRRESVAQRYLAAHHAEQRNGGEATDHTVERSSMFQYLEQLSSRQRAAVVLRFYEDMNYEQIAATLEVSIGTAKSHVSAGVKRLRELMDHTNVDAARTPPRAGPRADAGGDVASRRRAR